MITAWGCNKCISACSCPGTDLQSEKSGKSRIEVDGDKCIACGAGERITVLVAPAFKVNYPAEHEPVLGGLKNAGVNRIVCDRTQNLAETTQEIAASSADITEISSNIKEKLDELVESEGKYE